jgi:hypothetical protein
MALISTFELLLKPQLPKDITNKFPELAPLARTVLQGYFLTIANITDELVFLSVVVTTRTPGIKKDTILTTLDTTSVNGPVSGDFFDVGDTQKARFTFPINAKDTGLFILQANALNKNVREAADFELRGYAEIDISYSMSPVKSTKLLITAEHRGTFFGTDRAELGELAYALPLANGKSLYELEISS